jgi:hypothetical protein
MGKPLVSTLAKAAILLACTVRDVNIDYGSRARDMRPRYHCVRWRLRMLVGDKRIRRAGASCRRFGEERVWSS